jgi:hypothetical protein
LFTSTVLIRMRAYSVIVRQYPAPAFGLQPGLDWGLWLWKRLQRKGAETQRAQKGFLLFKPKRSSLRPLRLRAFALRSF